MALTDAPELTAPRTTPSAPAPAPLHVTDTRWTPAVWGLLVVLAGALFLDALDVSMVGVALPSIGGDLGMAPGSLQWIVSGYVLGYGGLLLLGGRASDLVGRRVVFLTAVAVFGAASVVSAMLSDPTTLIALRFLKGAAAAFTVPAGLSIITTTFAEGPARSRALSIYTVCGASGFSLGLVVGGALTELGWRATFLLPGPVALLLLAAGLRVVPRASRQRVRASDFDLPGALTSTASLLVFVYAVVGAPSAGWGSARTVGLLALAVALGVAFVLFERRHPRPLLRLGILRSGALVHANLAGAAMFGGYVAFQFVVTIYLQDALGWSPMSMALAFLPGGLIVVASALRMDRVLQRVTTSRLIAVGLVAFVAAYALFLRVEPGLSYWGLLFPTMVLLGVGFALTFPAVNEQATAGVSDDEQGLASGLVNTSIQIGGATVLAIVSAVIGAGGEIERGRLLPNMTTAIAVVVGVGVLGLLATLPRLRRAGQR
ncbi:MFS transporter [Jatrophihabitans fulvus]